jgi:hypothetical protein
MRDTLFGVAVFDGSSGVLGAPSSRCYVSAHSWALPVRAAEREVTMSRTSKLASVFAVCVVLAACSASETDFQKAAEEALVEAAERDNPGFKATASCAEPGSTSVGTTFVCSLTFDDGEVLPATAEIVSDSRVNVSVP